MRTFAQKSRINLESRVPLTLFGLTRQKPGLHHRAGHIMHLQGTIGNQALQRLLKTRDGPLEVDSTKTASAPFTQVSGRMPMQPAAERATQTKPASEPFEKQFGHRVEDTARGGETLGSLRAPMESAFGSDFSGVRIHYDSRADNLNARAISRGERHSFRPRRRSRQAGRPPACRPRARPRGPTTKRPGAYGRRAVG